MMKILKKCILIVSMLTICVGFSCKKEKSKIEEPVVIVPPVKEEEEQKAYLPTKIGTGSTSMTFSYSKNEQLSKIEYGDGTSAILTCDANNRPFLFQRLKGKVITSEAEYTLNDIGLVIRIDQYIFIDKGVIPNGYSTMEYNIANQLLKLSDYNNSDKLVNQRIRTYTPSGNLLNESNSSSHRTSTYNFDDKKAIFKYVEHITLFARETEEKLFTSAFNNIIDCKDPGNVNADQSYSYVYNSKGYPQTINFKSGTAAISTTKIVYQ